MNKWKIELGENVYHVYRRSWFWWDFKRTFTYMESAEEFINRHSNFPKYYK